MGRSLVVADNDRLLREAVAEFFAGRGFEVCTAADGLETLDAVRRVQPDCVILDIVMPKISGARVCRLIRGDAELRPTPIIAFSSLSVQDFRWFPELSPDAYVAKGPLPVACEHLLHAIERIRSFRAGPVSDALLGVGDVPPHPLVREVLEERHRLLELLDAIGGIVELDLDGRILRASAEACRVLGGRELDLIGYTLAATCAPADREALRTVMEEAIAAPGPPRRSLAVRLADRDVRLGLVGIGKGETAGLAVTFAAGA
jgi:PAS domain S-box-containing protein